MATDLLQAKAMLSAELLRIGLRSNVVGTARSMRVEDAVTAAGRNVHAVGVGRKVVEGRPTDQKAVRLYVVQKLAPSLLPPRDRLPEKINGVPTDVIESSPAFLTARAARSKSRPRSAVARAAAHADCTERRRRRQRPILAGISVAHRDITAGTLGYFCRSLRHGDDPTTTHILSNNHVLANVNEGAPGDDVYQPGPADNGARGDRIAQLKRFKPLDLNGNPNKVDAAIAELLPDVEWRAEICTIGGVVGPAQGVESMPVRKHGRTTGYTEGVITDESYDALIGIDHDNPSIVAVFQDQMRIEVSGDFAAFGRAGDSGSLVVKNGAPNAVGLYFAGPPSGSYGVANHIADVLSEMQLELVTSEESDVA